MKEILCTLVLSFVLLAGMMLLPLIMAVGAVVGLAVGAVVGLTVASGWWVENMTGWMQLTYCLLIAWIDENVENEP